ALQRARRSYHPIDLPEAALHPIVCGSYRLVRHCLSTPDNEPKRDMTTDTFTHLSNLTAETNSYVGRNRDFRDIALLIRNVRTLTLCGPGGIGKPRRAIRLGWQLAGDFPDGVWLVDLASTTDPAHAAHQVATALGVSEEHGRSAAATLADALRGRRLLLILD